MSVAGPPLLLIRGVPLFGRMCVSNAPTAKKTIPSTTKIYGPTFPALDWSSATHEYWNSNNYPVDGILPKNSLPPNVSSPSSLFTQYIANPSAAIAQAYLTPSQNAGATAFSPPSIAGSSTPLALTTPGTAGQYNAQFAGLPLASSNVGIGTAAALPSSTQYTNTTQASSSGVTPEQYLGYLASTAANLAATLGSVG